MSIPVEPVAVPDRVHELAGGAALVCVWQNDYGGLTFRATPDAGEPFYIKWGPRRACRRRRHLTRAARRASALSPARG